MNVYQTMVCKILWLIEIDIYTVCNGMIVVQIVEINVVCRDVCYPGCYCKTGCRLDDDGN